MLTALSQAIRDEPATPLGPGYLIATLGRLARLMAALEDLAHYGGAARLGTSWSRIGGLLAEAERLAHAGARQPPAGGSRCMILGQRTKGSCRFLAGFTAERSQSGQRPLWPG